VPAKHLPRRGALAAALAALAAGCGVAPERHVSPAEAAERWQAHRERVARLEGFTIEGRIGIRLPEEALSASVHWQHRGDAFDLRLHGPFNRGNVRIRGDSTTVRIQAPDYDRSAADAGALMREAFGWSLPVEGLPYWVRGIPEPGERIDELRFDEAGLMRALAQRGWEVEVTRYASWNGLELPARLELRSGAVGLKLAIRDWRGPPVQ